MATAKERGLQVKATAEEKAQQETAAADLKRAEDFVAQQRRTWAQVKQALEYMGTPFTQRGSPTREIGNEVLRAAHKWWKKVMTLVHTDKMEVSPMASGVTEEQLRRVCEAGDTIKHAMQHGWWATVRDGGRVAVEERNRRGGGSLPWEPTGGFMPPRPDFMKGLLLLQHEEKPSGVSEL